MTRWCQMGWIQRLMALVGIVSLGSPALAGSSDRSAAAETTAATASAAATAQSSQEIATLEAFRGGVTIIRLGLSQTPSPSMPLQLNDIVVTKQGRATVRFHSDGSVLRTGPDSRVQINESATERDITVFFGRIWAHVVRWQERVSRFRSGSTIAAIRGTEVSLAVAADGDETQLSVLEGQVETETDAGNLVLTGGQSAVGRKGVAPTLRVRMRPQDAVQWALYYVPVIYIKPSELGGGPWQDGVRESAKAYLKGDLQRAIDRLESVEVQTIGDPRFFTYRASLLLATGSVEEAGEDIRWALKLAANDSDALALQAIIAVANNEAKNALVTGQRAVEADPRSATAWIALSYAHQALFDLDGARESIETAVELEPNDALAWARLAEIRSSQGYLDEVLEAAQKAVELEPNLSRTQMVLGYAYLTRVQTREAQEAYRKAIELDQDDPLPRLGLGLAKIRESDLQGGRREIEVAASLDPNNSIVRSYLGKAYFEEKRTALTDREYATAKELDPNDPTPFFYDAIEKQTTNRPVEALHNLQKAIELNDNRAVYRSRLLLDSDLAARSASLGRIYTDLGFQQLALVEGWKSVNTDPSNYSAHRFLADSYSALPRHEIARVSELLQSQLLQPINNTPIQPRLAESNLFLISAGGPGGLSFNEFNPIFNRDGVTFQTSGLAGENSTYAGEGVLAGIYGEASFSLGYSHFETDGFRQNAGQDDDIGNAFFQLELTPQTSIQAEYRYRNNEHGDLTLRFFQDDFFPGRTFTEERHSIRLGARHAFSPGSILLGSFMYQDAEFRATDDELPNPLVTFFDIKRPESAFNGELQHLFRSRYFNLTSGVGHFDIDGRIGTTIGFDVPPPEGTGPFEFFETLSTDLQHTNVYEYAYIQPLKNVTVTVGLSADFVSGESPDVGDKDQFNPKFGITWEPILGTTLRAAAFRALKRTLITDQTLEPTQVAGFNQFFDDINGTESRRYGIAIDQKFTTDLFGGAEFSKRDLNVPFLDADDLGNTILREEDIDDYLGRGYLFWTPHRWLALRAEYMFERFKTAGTLSIGLPKKLDTHRVPLGISFFHPSGVSTSLGTTYVNQDGKEFILQSFERQSGRDDFWLVDAAINYRLPKRYGFITVGATNLLDEEFKFFDLDADNPSIQPDRMFFARVTLALP